MKIKHYSSSWPKNLKIPLTKQEDKFFRFLELSEDFEKDIKLIRLKYQIPPKGFPISKEHEVGLDIPKYLSYDKWDDYVEDSTFLDYKYGFSGTWGLTLTYFIKYNFMPKFAQKIEHRAAISDGKTTLEYLENTYPSRLKNIALISLREKLTKEQLKKLIDLQWNQIENLMKNLPEWDAKKQINIEIYKEIVKLRKKKNITWDEIATLLGNKFPNNDKVLDESYLRTIFRRYSKRLKNLPKPPVSLR